MDEGRRAGGVGRGAERRAGQPTAALPDAATVLDRVAVLVGAGVPPGRAWAIVLTRTGVGAPRVGAPCASARAGPRSGGDRAGTDGVPEGVRRASPAVLLAPLAARGAVWADVSAIVAIAERTGAPAAPALRSLARAVRDGTESARAVRVALAGPRASARVVLALPALGLLLGSLWGAGGVRTLVATPVGWVCGLAAGALVACGSGWSRRLIRAAEPPGGVPGAYVESWAVAVSGGGSVAAAADAVAEAWAERSGASDAVADRESTHVAEALGLAEDVGVPIASLLRATAEDVRREAATDGLAAAERLGVRLVLPLGVCVLPAFVLVGVVPVVIGVLSSTDAFVG